MPFTHRPYGDRGEAENPFISPSGPASQPSGPSYVAPGPSEPPMSSPPYGPPMPGQPGQPPWQQAWAPAYGAPYPGSQKHNGANSALVLGIISLVGVLTAPFCCITIAGAFCAPFAWVSGARALKEIDAYPGVYGNRGSAQAGMIMGIVCSALGLLVLAAIIAFAALVGSGWSMV
jgi:hypothetical protein